MLNPAYYQKAFHRVHEATGFVPRTFNWAAALLGPAWSGFRGIWGIFWLFLILEMIAWVQIGRGLWGNPGAEFTERAESQLGRAAEFRERADAAVAAGEDATRFETLADNMERAAERSLAEAESLNAEAMGIFVGGLVLLLVFKLLQGFYADILYEKQYSRWRIDPSGTEFGAKARNLAIALALIVMIAPLTIYKFTVASPLEILNAFPEEEISFAILEQEGATFYTQLASWLEARIDAAATAGSGAFDAITAGVRSVLNAMTIALIGTPWPVVMAVICVTAWRAAGPRVAIFTAAALAYIALLGYWEIAMETVALVGAAVIICVHIRDSARHLVREVHEGLQDRGADTGFDADSARVRLSDPDHRLFRNRKPARHSRHDHIRDAAGDPADGAGDAGSSRKHKGSRDGVRRDPGAALERRRGAARTAFDHDRGQPDDTDVPFHGCDHFADRRRRSREGDP